MAKLAIAILTGLLLVSVMLTVVSTSSCQYYPRCPEQATQRGSSCYRMFSGTVTWFEAQVLCQGYGGHLAVPETPEEGAFLARFAKEQYLSDRAAFTRSYIWIGGTLRFVKDQWVWLTSGHTPSYFLWEPGQPDGSGQCMQLLTRSTTDVDFVWDDYPCDTDNHFICETTIIT